MQIKIKEIITVLESKNIQNQRVGVYCTDDFFTYCAILALILHGKSFVPLNSKYPENRLAEMISLSGLDTIIYNHEIIENPFITCENIGFSNALNSEIKPLFDSEKYSFTQENREAYLLFTSGTTGQPKGVSISDSNLNSFFKYFKKHFRFTADEKFIQVFELTFDVSIFSFLMPIQLGACCYILPQTGIRYLEMIKMLQQHKITVATFVPTVLNYIHPYTPQLNFPSLKYSFFIGDKLNVHLAENWLKTLPNGKIINFYGPTEATIMCAAYEWNPKQTTFQNDIVPLGKPFDGINYIVVDEHNIPTDEKGELCLNGKQVITSYLNAVNEDKFIQLNNSNAIYYKTGDIVSIDSHGNLLFHDRIDNQLKINGHRIELSEVEYHLSKILNHFTICAFKNKESLTELVLFIESKVNIEVAVFQERIKKILPYYMLPNRIIEIDSIPLSFNSKIDKNCLHEIYLKEIS
ncbi:MAG: AMP-binding protein [Flavobacteriia bacterium]|nr:AMP-binding protein [Flavobacteriia bacterium]